MDLKPTDRLPIRLSVEDQRIIAEQVAKSKLSKTAWLRKKLGLPPAKMGRPKKSP